MGIVDSEDITIRVTEEQLAWAIQHINAFIASKPVNTEPLAHAFVSALSNPVRAVDSE